MSRLDDLVAKRATSIISQEYGYETRKKIIKKTHRLASELEKKGEKVTYLESAVPEFNVPSYVHEAVRTYLRNSKKTPPVLPSREGLIELRKAIAEREQRYNVDVDFESEIIVTVGAKQALNMAIQAMIEIGNEVLIPQPGFYPFDEIVRLAGGLPVHVPLAEERRFAFEPEEFEKRVSPKTKMIIINTPHNPTGHIATLTELEAIAEMARKHDLIVLSDEVFDVFTYDGHKHNSIASLPGMKDRTIIVNSFSKSYALYRYRIGYLIADRRLMKYIGAIHNAYVGFPSPILQSAALAALRGPQDWVEKMVKKYEKRRNSAVEALNKIPRVSCMKPEGTIVTFTNMSKIGIPSIELAEYLLKEAKVVTSPGKAWLKEGYLRIALNASEQDLIAAIVRIGEALEKVNKND